jgi:NAD(P)-dependent dehydrogenase (short-subunit alcohol dehydrogenase family)
MESLLKRGDRVWGIARSEQSAIEKKYPNQFKSSVCDVSNWDQVNEIGHIISNDWRSIDALITCAGVQGEIGRALTADPLKWEKTISANLSGTYFSIRAFHSLISLSPNRGKIICFSGGGATKARANFSAYGSAKTAIVRLVETIAEEEKLNNLDINSIAPGSINTRLTDEVLSLGPSVTGAAEYASALQQKKEGGQSLIKAIGLIEWLLSSKSNGVTGKLISAQWDPWDKHPFDTAKLTQSDVYTLRRILPEDRKNV